MKHVELPASPDTEHAVLCSLLSQAREVWPVVGEFGLKPDHFHIPANRTVFEVTMELCFKREEVDHVTVSHRLKEEGKLMDVGGEGGVFKYVDINGRFPSLGQVKEHCEILDSCLKKRRTYLLCRDYAKKALNGVEASELVSGLVEDANNINAGRSVFKSTRDLVIEVLSEMEAIAKKEKKIQAQTTGITQLDKALCGGMRPGDFVLISGETKGGKSILAHNIAEHAACHQGKPVILFSLEMRAKDVIERMIASVTITDFTRMRNGWLEVPELNRMKERIRLISRSNLIIRDDITSLTQITSSIRQFKNAYPEAACAIVDYCQLVDVETSKGENREMAVAKISTSLRRAGMQLDIPIIILSQENDDGRARESRRLEQDCTTWIKLRKDEGNPKKNIEPNENIRHCDIKLNRNGPPCTFKLTYRPQYLRLENHSEEDF